MNSKCLNVGTGFPTVNFGAKSPSFGVESPSFCYVKCKVSESCGRRSRR